MAREIKGGREKERERESKGVCVREKERDPSVSKF